MPGNSKRHGATRKAGSKKGPTVGSGGKGRRALEGKGPTPKAEDREYHAAHRRKTLSDRSPRHAASGASRSRPAGGPEIVAGRNAVLEALRTGVRARGLDIFSRIEADDRVKEILHLALEADVEVREVAKAHLDSVTGGAAHQGVALEVEAFAYLEVRDLLEVDGVPLIVVLDGIQDPRNLGAILRSAAAFGATGVLLPERRAAGVTVSAWKTSAGAAARIPIARATNLTRAIEELKEQRVFVIGLAADGDHAIAESTLLAEPLAIVVGSEGKGLSRLVRESCDEVAGIPITARTESLNASVAAAVALYEVAKAR